MKSYLFPIIICILFLNSKVNAQETVIASVNQSDVEKYIALAKKNYAKRKVQEATSESFKQDINVAKMSYLDLFGASYIYRPPGKTVIDPINPYNVNGFQLGVNFNLGSFLQKPFNVKKAKANYMIAKFQQLDFDNELVVEVKKRYYDYLQQKSLLKVYTKSAQDSKGVAESARYRFEKGQVTLDVYNESRIAQTSAMSLQIQTESDFLKAKDLFEEIIGQELADVK
ncbi:TolC family protein [Pedobacter sp. Leaf250]|uniref:TolC family protein n=1 Tax=Pedobacter sp. Leaf250 TaxID=2876559 RepID=UPI001E5837B4|nr:TolC family protein [Pedobacter sp. Leaf250]